MRSRNPSAVAKAARETPAVTLVRTSNACPLAVLTLLVQLDRAGELLRSRPREAAHRPSFLAILAAVTARLPPTSASNLITTSSGYPGI
jgi:hypothetical protein